MKMCTRCNGIVPLISFLNTFSFRWNSFFFHEVCCAAALGRRTTVRTCFRLLSCARVRCVLCIDGDSQHAHAFTASLTETIIHVLYYSCVCAAFHEIWKRDVAQVRSFSPTFSSVHASYFAVQLPGV